MDPQSDLLLLASDNIHAFIIKYLLNTGANVNAVHAWSGRTPLSLAAGDVHEKSEGVIKVLLDGHADPMLVGVSGRTPLHYAAEAGLERRIWPLMRAGCDVDHVDKEGLTALSLAAKNGHLNTIRTLLQTTSAKAGIKDRNGHSALFWAVKQRHVRAAKMLLLRKLRTDYERILDKIYREDSFYPEPRDANS